MARLAAAFGSSHSVMLAAELPDWLSGFRQSDLRMKYYDRDGKPRSYDDVLAAAPANIAGLLADDAVTARYNEVQAAMKRMRAEIAQANLDALVIVGDDQHELFKDQHMPSIGIYYGESIRNVARANAKRFSWPEEWYNRAQMRRYEDDADADYPCHKALALRLIEGLVEREFDIAAVAGLADGQNEGHAYSFIHRWYLKGEGARMLPVVPIFLNTYNPPNPPLPKRCVRLGRALKELIESYPEDLRVGVLASGGLSHFVVEEELDHAVIEALRKKDLDYLAGLDPRRLKAGSSEIRNWIVVASAATHLDLKWLSYTPSYRTPAGTGIGLGFASWS
ncbi:MAG TPA: protocatechuate 3,4-dioxygenase [Burkholderiales bacterium]|jgi:3-O-methylgallate 3,4-dioxygenase|nr:protocatechuate 3,4-dioxygenase [Burkholderiales bacterium]